MKNITHHPFSRILNNQKGVSAILVAILLPVLIGFAALAIDVGYMYTTKNELQNIADAAALAGAGELGRIYVNEVALKDHISHVLEVEQEERIREEAQDVALLNNAANKSITLEADQIFIGRWDWSWEKGDPGDPLDDTPKIESPDAVRVIAINNTPVSTFFARIFGISGQTFIGSAKATAALSGIGTVEPGQINVPFAISVNHSCDDGVILLNPPKESCMGWHNFFDPMDANSASTKMYEIIKGYGPDSFGGKSEGETWLETHFNEFYNTQAYDKLDDNVVTPGASAGEDLSQQGGTITSLINGDWYKTWETIDNPQEPSQSDPKDPTIPKNMKNPIPFLTLYDFFRFRDGDGTGTDMVDFCDPPNQEKADDVWTAVAPIYNETGDECQQSNNVHAEEIVGFAKVRIFVENRKATENGIDADEIKLCYDCDYVYEEGRGSGNNIGNVKGAIPNLVE